MNEDLELLKTLLPEGYELDQIDRTGQAILSVLMLLTHDVYCSEITGDGTLLDSLKASFAKEICSEVRDRMLTTISDLAVSMIERGMTT